MKIVNLLLAVPFFTLSNSFCHAQQNVQLQHITTNEKIFTGNIDGNEITLYLHAEETSPGHRNLYSVSGWYFYDKYQKQIPLVGVVNSDQLTLYQFDDKLKRDTVLHFLYEQGIFWETMAHYDSLEGWVEKFDINYPQQNEPITGVWQMASKQLPVQLNDNDLFFRDEYFLLNIFDGKDTTTINLTALKLPPGLHLSKYLFTKTGLSVLLDYSHPSRGYALGMCGAGDEEGVVFLQFDKQFRLINLQNKLLNSCLLNLTSTSKTIQSGVIKYTVTKATEGEGSASFILDVNKMEIR